MKRYLTKERLEQLKKELEELKLKRQEIAQRLEEAKALGDLSENTEYVEAKEAQAFNEGRIRELEQIIKEAIIISKTRQSSIQVGSTIKVKSKFGIQEFTIVGSEEAQPSEGKISNDSPLGRAFLGREVGDEVEVKTPRGEVKYKILSIS